MSTDRETTRIVRSWLQADEHESAERLLGSVFDLLDATPQRRQPWRAWRTRLMSGTAKVAAVAAVALVVALLPMVVKLVRAQRGGEIAVTAYFLAD